MSDRKDVAVQGLGVTQDTETGGVLMKLQGGFIVVNASFRGDYDPGSTYQRGDVVTEEGSSYVATGDGPAQAPPSDGWQLLSSRGDPGPASVHNINRLVTDGEVSAQVITLATGVTSYAFTVVVVHADGTPILDASLSGLTVTAGATAFVNTDRVIGLINGTWSA